MKQMPHIEAILEGMDLTANEEGPYSSHLCIPSM